MTLAQLNKEVSILSKFILTAPTARENESHNLITVMDRVNFKYHYIACFKDHISSPQIDKKVRLLCKFTINTYLVKLKAAILKFHSEVKEV